jgi:hypothetical protein
MMTLGVAQLVEPCAADPSPDRLLTVEVIHRAQLFGEPFESPMRYEESGKSQ